MKLETVRATGEMAEELGYIHAMSWQEAYRGIVPEDYLAEFTPEKRAEAFRQAMEGAEEEYWLFRVEGRGAGLALLHKRHGEEAEEGDGEIYAIYFHPDYWGQECTGQAFGFCIRRLEELGYRRLFIQVLEDNLRARAFYEKFGFRWDGSRQDIHLGKELSMVRYVREA